MDFHDNSQSPSTLPSKRFLKRGAIAVGLIAVVLLVQTTWFKNIFTKKNDTADEIAADTTTLGELAIKDSNNNGFADWEERLFGLDPAVVYTKGVSNKQIIEQKKRDLATGEDTETLNETDLLARQLFSITNAMGESSSTNSNSLASLGGELGATIELKQAINHYSYKDIRTIKTTPSSLQSYYTAMNAATKTFKQGPDEIGIMVRALETGDFTELSQLNALSTTYIDLAKSLKTVVVPVGITEQHLSLMNGYYGMGESFYSIVELEDNGLNALSGIALYKQYAELVTSTLLYMNDYFVEYGIL